MYKKFGKRTIDIIGSLILFVPFVFIFMGVYIAIKIDDRGPVFYKGERLGKDGKSFKMYKFRSMKVNAPDWRLEDGSTYNDENDPRQTRVGKFLRKTSLDEIPQIINVLKGEMSLIGPRPDTVDSYETYSDEEKKRLDVLPGITGYSQAFYRNSISANEKIKNDIYYVRKLGLLIDIKVVIKTIYIIVKKDNVYNNISSNNNDSLGV